MTQHSERRSLALGWFVEHARFTVHPWPDSSIDCASYDARHSYVEHFWLPVPGELGPRDHARAVVGAPRRKRLGIPDLA